MQLSRQPSTESHCSLLPFRNRSAPPWIAKQQPRYDALLWHTSYLRPLYSSLLSLLPLSLCLSLSLSLSPSIQPLLYPPPLSPHLRLPSDPLFPLTTQSTLRISHYHSSHLLPTARCPLTAAYLPQPNQPSARLPRHCSLLHSLPASVPLLCVLAVRVRVCWSEQSC